MNDKLKDFINENRVEFDSEQPSANIFNSIRENLDTKKKIVPISWRNMLVKAAVIVFLVGVGALLYYVVDRASKIKDEQISSNPADEYVDIMDPVYAKQIDQFKDVIVLKQSQLKQLEQEHPQLYREFVEDITRLDSAYRELKTDLPENPNKEVLLDAMLQNLQLQSELLNKQLIIIKEIKQKSQSHEKSNT